MNAVAPMISRLPPPPRLPPVKACTCCARVHTRECWAALPFVGLQDDGEGGLISLRNCICGSTLAVELSFELSQ